MKFKLFTRMIGDVILEKNFKPHWDLNVNFPFSQSKFDYKIDKTSYDNKVKSVPTIISWEKLN